MISKAQDARAIFTYQSRPVLDAAQIAALDSYAALYGRAERSLFAAMQAGGTVNDLKRAFQPQFAITARQFNAMRVSLQGKMDSIKARRPELIADLNARINKATKVIAKLALRPSQAAKLHQKKRRLAILERKHAQMQSDHRTGAVRLCFGSKTLFRAQFELDANGYADYDAWKADWQTARSSQIFVLGSKDELAGNQSCQASVNDDGTLDLKLRLPDALGGSHGKYITIHGVRFAYGHKAIMAALASSERIATVTKTGKATFKYTGTALSYRFVRDAKGWRVFVSCEAPAVELKTKRTLGAIGVDINAGVTT